MGSVAHEGMAGALPAATDHPFSDILNAARNVVFSGTLTTAEWSSELATTSRPPMPLARVVVPLAGTNLR